MTLFDYPEKAHFGRILPKSKIYEYAGITTKIKDLFVRQVDQITWKYKLAPETINVPASKAVPEIQVFSVALKTRQLKEDVLRSIDKAIPFPIIFELTYGSRVRTMAAYKRQSEADSGKWVVGSYFASEWMPDSTPRNALPITLDLGALYAELLRTLIPYPAKPGEMLHEQLERAEVIRIREVELARVAATLKREKQFNRKVQINTKIRAIQEEIEKLKAER